MYSAADPGDFAGPVVPRIHHNNVLNFRDALRAQRFNQMSHDYRAQMIPQNYIGRKPIIPESQTYSNTYQPQLTNPLTPEEPWLRNVRHLVTPRFSQY